MSTLNFLAKNNMDILDELMCQDLDRTMRYYKLEQEWKQMYIGRNFVKELLETDPKLAFYINTVVDDEKVKKKTSIYVRRKHTPQYIPIDIRAKMNESSLFEHIESVWSTKFRLNGCRCQLPWHKDSTASFHIYPQSNSFYCFGCARWWSFIDFLMHNDKMELKQAIDYIKRL